MARPKKYIVLLSKSDTKKLHSLLHKKATLKSIIRRCQILLELDEKNKNHLTQVQIAKAYGVCEATVSNIVRDYAEHGLDEAVTYKRNPNSNARRKIDGRTQARISVLVIGIPPGRRFP